MATGKHKIIKKALDLFITALRCLLVRSGTMVVQSSLILSPETAVFVNASPLWPYKLDHEGPHKIPKAQKGLLRPH